MSHSSKVYFWIMLYFVFMLIVTPGWIEKKTEKKIANYDRSKIIQYDGLVKKIYKVPSKTHTSYMANIELLENSKVIKVSFGQNGDAYRGYKEGDIIPIYTASDVHYELSESLVIDREVQGGAYFVPTVSIFGCGAVCCFISMLYHWNKKD